jgi:uncharacterized FlgJ-related protein
MIYKFDKEKLVYVKDKRKARMLVAGVATALVLFFIIGRYTSFETLDKFEKELVILNLEKERNKFTEEKLISLMKDLNIKFPHIVLAQAKLESGNYKSKIFKQNHNLFGMRQARVRVNTAKGTNLNHAYYDNWQESVYDYAFYQCRYMSDARTEQDYFAALDASYAEANKYSATLKHIIQKENLRQIFK